MGEPREKWCCQLIVWQSMKVILRRFHRGPAEKPCRHSEGLQWESPMSSQLALCHRCSLLAPLIGLLARDARHWEMYSGLLERHPTSEHPLLLISAVVSDGPLEFTPLGWQQSSRGRRCCMEMWKRQVKLLW